MSTPTDENRDLLTVAASMREAEGRTEELRAALEALHLVDFAGKIGGLLDESGLSVNRVRRIA